MANRRFEQYALSLEKKVVSLFMNVSIGATGAPTLVSGTLGASFNKGIWSIVRNSAGNYTIKLGVAALTTVDTYQRLLMISRMNVSAAASTAPGLFVVTDNSANGLITVQFTNSTGTATDPASGEVILLTLMLSNSGI
jgi:hypothetical protein